MLKSGDLSKPTSTIGSGITFDSLHICKTNTTHKYVP